MRAGPVLIACILATGFTKLSCRLATMVGDQPRDILGEHFKYRAASPTRHPAGERAQHG
jgi:hypothetical protein